MSSNFWTDLGKPIIGLSPMDGVTDHPFRHITKKYGKPAIVYTEFTSVEGVCHRADQLLKDFLFDETQRPIIAQIYGTTPSFFRQTATVLCELGFDGIDINMGCPAKNVAHSGAGAALIKTPKLAQEIIRETKAGIQDWVDGKSSRDCPDISEEIAKEVEKRHAALPSIHQERRSLPVSVKTRIGYDQPVIQEWISNLLEMEPVAIALHGRTLKQQYSGLANWELIAEAAALAHQTKTLLLGNGDIKSRADALEKVAQYKLDGVLIGKNSMGNPRIFLQENSLKVQVKVPVKIQDATTALARQLSSQPSIFQIALEHAQLFEQTFGHDERYNFLPMRKHLGWYIHDIPQASQIRQEIYRTNSSQEFAQVLAKYNVPLEGSSDILAK